MKEQSIWEWLELPKDNKRDGYTREEIKLAYKLLSIEVCITWKNFLHYLCSYEAYLKHGLRKYEFVDSAILQILYSSDED